MNPSPDQKPSLCYVCEATAGGMRKHLRQLVTHFAKPDSGFLVSALLGDRGEPGFREDVEAFQDLGVRVEMIPSFQRAIRPGPDWRAYADVCKAIRSIQPDIVHTHSAKGGFVGRLAAHSCGVPLIIHTPHVLPFQWASGLMGRFYLMLERYAGRRCHRIVCLGESQLQVAREARVIAKEKLELIPNGVAVPDPIGATEVGSIRRGWDISADVPVVGMVARLAPQKGVGLFLDAAEAVLKDRKEAVFVVVGGGPLEEEVRARAVGLGLGPDRMKFLGHVEDAERLYPAFDVAVLSSLYEGLPYVLLEAMAWGVPVVATDVFGSRDAIVDGDSGLLASVCDSSALAGVILRVLGDAGLRARLVDGARKRVRECFSLTRFYERHRGLYLGEA